MADPGQNELMLKNFMKFLPPDKATQAFASFEVTLNGTITKQALVKWVVDVFKERKSLSLTLNDNRTVIIKINQLLDAVSTQLQFQILNLNLKFRKRPTNQPTKGLKSLKRGYE